jgi:hypothetical protein
MLAHLVGIPVEEAALSLAPIAVATGGVAGVKLRAARRRASSSTGTTRDAGASHPRRDRAATAMRSGSGSKLS